MEQSTNPPPVTNTTAPDQFGNADLENARENEKEGISQKSRTF
jgi:hypothetical protein